MGRIWLEASTLAHTEVNVRKVKNVGRPRKKTAHLKILIKRAAERPANTASATVLALSKFDARDHPH